MKEEFNFDRKDLFEHYDSCDDPFLIVVTKIDVTRILDYCKRHRNHYATIGYCITKAVNRVENFKYRYENKKIVKYKNLNPNFTQKLEKNIGFYEFEYTENYESFIKKYKEVENEFFRTKQSIINDNQNCIWMSCSPWFKFSSINPPRSNNITIPQFIWDKFEREGDKYFINLMIMAHHGFVDGSHIGEFIKCLNEEISGFDRKI